MFRLTKSLAFFEMVLGHNRSTRQAYYRIVKGYFPKTNKEGYIYAHRIEFTQHGSSPENIRHIEEVQK